MSGQAIGFRNVLQTVCSGYDGKTCWVHARCGAIPQAGKDGKPAVVMTTQKLLLSGSDVFFGLHDLRSDDLGRSWTGPAEQPALGRRQLEGGIETCPCDFVPKYHAASGRLLGIGHEARYIGDRLEPAPRRRSTVYSVYDAGARTWSEWRRLDLGDEEKFFSAGSGSGQRVDMPDGTILLPIYFHSRSDDAARAPYATTVLRCRFDGVTLSRVEQGQELTVPQARGLYEPSLTFWQGRYFLTLRNDLCGYVARGRDGLNFEQPRPWTFDDGSDLGNYNTQQHWLTHAKGLFLVYTRRGAGNDHVFRHRAPLFAAQVDPERLCVIRSTERILIPQRGARLGNFGVAEVNDSESWVTVCEWMQPAGCERYGSDNSIFAARVMWDEPNVP